MNQVIWLVMIVLADIHHTHVCFRPESRLFLCRYFIFCIYHVGYWILRISVSILRANWFNILGLFHFNFCSTDRIPIPYSLTCQVISLGSSSHHPHHLSLHLNFSSCSPRQLSPGIALQNPRKEQNVWRLLFRWRASVSKFPGSVSNFIDCRPPQNVLNIRGLENIIICGNGANVYQLLQNPLQ